MQTHFKKSGDFTEEKILAQEFNCLHATLANFFSQSLENYYEIKLSWP